MNKEYETTVTTIDSIQIHLQYAYKYLLQNKPNLAAAYLQQARESLEKFHNANIHSE